MSFYDGICGRCDEVVYACTCSKENELAALKEENRKLREALEQCSCECIYLDDRKCARCKALADSSQGKD